MAGVAHGHGAASTLAAALLVAAAAAGLAAVRGGGRAARLEQEPASVVVFLTDGMGPQYVGLARAAKAASLGGAAAVARGAQPPPLAFEAALVGAVRTSPSADAAVTDSAAGGSALATGVLHRNGRISVGGAATLLERAKRSGMRAGAVTTARVTHASPAAFTAHSDDREQEAAIAPQQLALRLDVLLGGGRREFRPERRADGRDLEAEAVAAGYALAHTADELAAATAAGAGPVLGLFNDSHISYALDRRGRLPFGAHRAAAPTREPTLAQMAAGALAVLRRDAPRGFVLFVEAGRIDHGGHTNDALAAVAEVLEFEEAWEAVRAAVGLDTLVVSTSDHDCGGLSIGCCGSLDVDYAGLVALRSTMTLLAHGVQHGADAAAALERAGFADAEARLPRLAEHEEAIRTRVTAAAGEHSALSVEDLEADFRGLARDVARAHGVGFTSTDHTGSDVPLFAYGPGAGRLAGVHGIDAVGRALHQAVTAAAGSTAAVA